MKTLLHAFLLLSTCLVSSTVLPQCTATIQYAENGRGGYSFQATNLVDTSASVKYYWTIFSDTTIIYTDSSGTQTNFTFTQNGSYQVCLNISDTACNFDTCKAISVSDAVYYPLLDSINLWILVNNLCPLLPPPNPNSDLLRSNCYFCNMINTEEDTLYNGINYTQLYLTHGSYGGPNLYGLIREDTALRKIYYNSMDGNGDLLLYDFSMQVGDSVYLIIPNYSGGFDTGFYRLDSIISVIILAGDRRVFFLNSSSQSSSPLVWLEGVGNLGELVHEAGLNSNSGCGVGCMFYPYDEMVPYTNVTNVSCFYHTNQVYFDSCAYHSALIQEQMSWATVEDSCSYILSGIINEIATLNSFEISPIPANAYATASLEVKQADKFVLLIYNLQGKQVSDEMNLGLLSAGTHKITLTLQGLSGGFYLVECRAASGSLFRKLVIE